MKQSKTALYAVYGLIAIFVASFLFFLITVIYSSLESISVMSLNSRAQTYETTEKKFSELESNYKEWQNIDNIFEKFKDVYLIEFDHYPGFRTEMENLFRKNGLQIMNSIAPKYKNQFQDIRKVTFSLQLSGTYRGLKNFIFEMEKKKEMILFNSLELSKLDMGNRVLAKISMEVYFVR